MHNSMRAIVALVVLHCCWINLAYGDDSTRTPEELLIARRMRAGTAGYGAPRPPGTLLLNMLIKNEEDHLARTLPRWAKIIDYWVIGVDDNNTDSSPAVIRKHLGHIPGEIVIVHFDGMGPTWTQLVEHGIKRFPEATHGILADADFAPMKDHLDKMQLDIRCSKHMYTIWSNDAKNERKMDWIYRNIPGASVHRRTHQILEVPEIPYQEVFQTLVDLPVSEQEGGYQDRTPGKNERYIGFLEADLRDFPNDTRTLYYLGYAHYDNFKRYFDQFQSRGQLLPASHEGWAELRKGMDYMRWRISIPTGNKEERYFTMLKVGEIYERYLHDWRLAEQWYLNCTLDDPERADPFFYLGQHYRLTAQYRKAHPHLKTASQLPIPTRSLFHWHFLYNCVAKVEWARNGDAMIDELSLNEVKEILDALQVANCVGEGEQQVSKDHRHFLGVFKSKYKELKRIAEKNKPAAVDGAGDGDSAVLDAKVVAVQKLLRRLIRMEEYEDKLSKIQTDVTDDDDHELTADKALSQFMDELQRYVDRWEAKLQKHTKKNKKRKKKRAFKKPSCRRYRKLTAPFLRFFKKYKNELQRVMSDKSWTKLERRVDQARELCR